jgi:glyoxylase-like metal-dependent hydrolase (beta-lactamase superfamily II)
VWVGISSAWQTTLTVYGTRAPIMVDGPVTPDDVIATTTVDATHLIATHADWDHLLAPLACPDARRLAGAATRARLRVDGAAVAGELDAWDRRHGIPPRRLPDWTDARVLAAPGRVDLPGGGVETAATPGHTADGIAVLLTTPAVLVVGDYLSPCEIPSWEPGGAAEYLAALDTLDRLAARAEWVVPGHGWPLGAARARALITEDRRYVEELMRTGDAPLPRHRGDADQRRQHLRNRAAAGVR